MNLTPETSILKFVYMTSSSDIMPQTISSTEVNIAFGTHVYRTGYDQQNLYYGHANALK
jgi:hypothetical protein